MLKLAKLPDRTPVKITICVLPDLHQALILYAAIYEKIYGAGEAVADLIPAMIENFLASDRAFMAERREALKAHETGRQS